MESMELLGQRITTLVEKGDNMLASAAVCAKEARDRYDAGEKEGFATWELWWDARTKLSRRRGYDLLAIGRAPDPVKAAVEHKAKKKASVQATRRRQREGALRSALPTRTKGYVFVEEAACVPKKVWDVTPDVDAEVAAVLAAWAKASPAAKKKLWDVLWDEMMA